MGGCESSGKVATTRTPGSAFASEAYTMPNGVSPRATSMRAARTLSDSASLGLTPFHSDSDSSEAFAYLPAGTVRVWPTARRPSPSAASNVAGRLRSTCALLALGAISTSRLPSKLRRVATSSLLRCCR